MLAAGSLAAIAALPVDHAFAQRKAQADADVAELMKAGDLPDQSIGSADAKVTVVEYASMTCGHCATFHKKVFPALKTKYVDTGKVRFIMREFPLDDLAAAASMLSRCAGGSDVAKSYDLTAILFEKQDDWAFVKGNPVPKLFEIAKQAGFTQDSFDKCLTDQKLLERITAVRERGSAKFGVNSTPSFFINGKRLNDAPSVENFEKAFELLLKAS
ncbi:MAG: DsbA family protein [Hyphomicrobiaceae bacterium]